MNKHLRNILLLGTAIMLLTACATPVVQPAAQPTAQPTAAPTQTIAITSTPIVIVVTATPIPATATVEQPTATATLEPATNTPEPKITFTSSIPGAYNADGVPIKSDSSIIITNIKETSSGQALLSWTATGTFSTGFRIYYSSYIKVPSIGSEKSEYAIPDGTNRSAYVTGTPGTTYYYRICSYTGSGCDFYSNIYTFTYLAATSTP